MNPRNTNCPDWLIYAYKSRLISEARLDEIWLKLTQIWSQNNRQAVLLAKWQCMISGQLTCNLRQVKVIYPPSFDLTLLH